MSNRIQIAVEEASEQPTSMQIGVRGACPPGHVQRWLTPLGLNPLWACGHVVAHHSADRQVPDWGRPRDCQTSLIATVKPTPPYCDLTAGHMPH